MAKNKSFESVDDWWSKINQGSNGKKENIKPINENLETKEACAWGSIGYGIIIEKNLWAWFLDLWIEKENQAKVLISNINIILYSLT